MTHRAHVELDIYRDALAIRLRNRTDAITVAYSFPRTDLIVTQPGETINAEPLYLPEDAARALYEALAQWFGNATDNPTALRSDYLAERGRVDRLIATVSAIAERPATDVTALKQCAVPDQRFGLPCMKPLGHDGNHHGSGE
jgi:hypothetical protein